MNPPLAETAPPPPTGRAAVADRLHDQLVVLLARARKHESSSLRQLAALRRGTGRGLDYNLEAEAALLSLLGPSAPPYREDDGGGSRTPDLVDDAMLVASLVAFSRPWLRRADVPSHGSFGRDLRRLNRTRDSGVADGLMRAVLGSEREDLDRHLRRAVSLLAADDLALDDAALLRDLGSWNAEDRRVQRRWAYHYWAGIGPDDTPNAAADETSGDRTPDTDPVGENA